ncbi:M20/M25/M40 family metallo-hydrolase [Nordella sp. HKS 07]|uniref:M20/M25/M40 family metallo-hydrolase n=1 Tax=Nordella sp. HKS 07 TaxID=2712222 RepID=UPI0013E12D97|nr:M20/M25/M40 family metallo-hydrolase [Nordella sp. HKS 07]QIG47558.1 M20/M25/M40 family metallo-hydrolase [Nordella sp. HKS 07]
MTFDLAARTRAAAIQMTQWRSVTGSPEECDFPHLLRTMLAQNRYFRLNPEHLRVQPLGDGTRRSNLLALVKGEGRKTVVLAGHFDTVPFDDYAELAPFACDPEALLPMIIDKLKRTGENPQALADLESGEYLPGRGLLDMKSGIAAGIAVLEAFAAEEHRQGNVLLLATPDEEDRSAGMRKAAALLPEIARESGLDISLVINLDSIADDGDGSFGRSVTTGSIGKLLLTALVIGRETHACYPFAGINASYLAAELLSEFECAPELAETSGHEIAAPPSALYVKDVKSGYNVTTPARIFLYWNTLQHRRGPAEVLSIATGMAREAMERAVARLAARARAVSPPQPFGEESVAVLSFAELVAQARRSDPDFETSFALLNRELADRQDLDFPARARLITEFVWASTKLPGPAVILGFGSLPYPAVTLKDEALGERLMAVLDQAAAEKGTTVSRLGYFPGISDMSFLGEASGDLSAAEANTPVWGASFALGPSPAYPVINIGPWGRDYHHWLERLHMPYAFDVLPLLVLRATKAALE